MPRSALPSRCGRMSMAPSPCATSGEPPMFPHQPAAGRSTSMGPAPRSMSPSEEPTTTTPAATSLSRLRHRPHLGKTGSTQGRCWGVWLLTGNGSGPPHRVGQEPKPDTENVAGSHQGFRRQIHGFGELPRVLPHGRSLRWRLRGWWPNGHPSGKKGSLSLRGALDSERTFIGAGTSGSGIGREADLRSREKQLSAGPERHLSPRPLRPRGRNLRRGGCGIQRHGILGVLSFRSTVLNRKQLRGALPRGRCTQAAAIYAPALTPV